MSKTSAGKSKQSSSKAKEPQQPPPFEKAPASIEPLLTQLNPANVYITHIDKNLPEYKKSIYLIPVLLNATIAVLLVWRIYAAVPKYFALLQTLLGYASSATINTNRTTRQEQIWTVLRRTLMMIADFGLFRFVGPALGLYELKESIFAPPNL